MTASDRYDPTKAGQPMNAMFVDVQRRLINYEYFQDYFDRLALPRALAEHCLRDVFEEDSRRGTSAEYVAFIRRSTLQRLERLPNHRDVQAELVDYRHIDNLVLQGPLSWWDEDHDSIDASPCVFVSHRWQSTDHPDPDGTTLRQILSRLEQIPGEVYLWIDYCCLPQSRAGTTPTAEETWQLQRGLARMSEIVKSCDLLILYTEDYLDRVWCYTEIVVWMCRVAAAGSRYNDDQTRLFRSALTRQLIPAARRSSGFHLREATVANLRFRGYAGTDDDLLAIYRPIDHYCSSMIESAHHHLGMSNAFDTEYLPTIIRFLGDTWTMLQDKQATQPDDVEICFRIIVDALKFSRQLQRPER